MTQQDLDVLDTIGMPDYLSGELSDTGKCFFFTCCSMYADFEMYNVEVDIPAHMVPPNPDDSDGSAPSPPETFSL